MATIRRFEPSDGYPKLFQSLEGELRGAATLRREKFARFTELGFPNQRVEDWKYTGLSALAKLQPTRPAQVPVAYDAVEPYFLSDDDALRLVFVNGHLVSSLSATEHRIEGLSIRSLPDMVPEDQDILVDNDRERSLTALNAALAHGGAVIKLAAGVNVEPVIQLLFVSTGGPSAIASPRNHFELGDGASLKLAETHVALDGAGVTNLVNRCRLGDRADLIHDRLQLGAESSTLIGKTYVNIGVSARLRQTLATFGGALVRNETLGRIDGAEAELTLNGVYSPTGNEHVDNQIRIEHRAPNCESNQFYKGIMMGRSHAVFAGKILVEQAAQKTDAYQQNNNLLLSRDAEIDTKPELEIYADDVKCSHGATASDLDADGLFYLRSRGIDEPTARSLLTYAYASEVLERFDNEDVKHQARRALFNILPGGDRLMELV
ncbi:MAG: Fe-S cluster assembly protein SufD [Geminicoccaceae bacterium]